MLVRYLEPDFLGGALRHLRVSPNPPRSGFFWKEWAGLQHHQPDSVFMSLPNAQCIPGLPHTAPLSGAAHTSLHISEPIGRLAGSTYFLFTFLGSFTVCLLRPGPSTWPLRWAVPPPPPTPLQKRTFPEGLVWVIGQKCKNKHIKKEKKKEKQANKQKTKWGQWPDRKEKKNKQKTKWGQWPDRL